MVICSWEGGILLVVSFFLMIFMIFLMRFIFLFLPWSTSTSVVSLRSIWCGLSKSLPLIYYLKGQCHVFEFCVPLVKSTGLLFAYKVSSMQTQSFWVICNSINFYVKHVYASSDHFPIFVKTVIMLSFVYVLKQQWRQLLLC